MFRVRWHHLLSPFRRTTSAVTNFSKKSSENGSLWLQKLGKHLLVTNTVGSGLLIGIGDAVAQYIEGLNEKEPFDYSRSRSMIITGLLIGPVQHGFYILLERTHIGNKNLGVLQKLLADQLIMSPIYILMFFYISSLLEGHSVKECNKQIKEQFLYTWAMDCIFWPGLQYLNFRYLTATYRVVFINAVNCVYIVLLSYIKHGFGKHKNSNQENQHREKSYKK